MERRAQLVGQDLAILCAELARHEPAHGLRVRALALRDPTFRSICEDYDEARRAAERWRIGDDVNLGRAQEFDRIAGELCEEALDYLKSGRSA